MDGVPEMLENITSGLLTKLSDIHCLLDLCRAHDDDGERERYLDVINACVSGMAGLVYVVRQLREEVERQRAELERIQAIKQGLSELQLIGRHCLENVPQHLPRPKNEEAERKQESGQTKTVKGETSDGNNKENHVASQNSSVKTNSSVGNKKQSKFVYVPALEYITVEDFETVPKYMKGRITYTQVNSAIDELNKAYKEKYKIMGTKKSTLNDVNRKRYEAFKLLESKDTAGEHFIVERDIKEFGYFKLDSVGRNILTILRHCGRMKEIRGGGHTRYAIIEVY